MLRSRSVVAHSKGVQPSLLRNLWKHHQTHDYLPTAWAIHMRVNSGMAFHADHGLQPHGFPNPDLLNRGLPTIGAWPLRDTVIANGRATWSEWPMVTEIELPPLVLVPMAADLLHSGHINILNIAQQYGRVVVGLITDEGMRSYKRDPILPYTERERMLRCYRQVDDVIPFDGVDYTKYIREFKPMYFIHGDDWCDPASPQFQSRADAIEMMRTWNGEVVEPAYTQGVSTTQIIKRCAAECQQAPTHEVASTNVRTFQDVWHLLPNQITYLRLAMGMAPAVLPLEYYTLSAGLYLTSHALDLIDGAVARTLNQTSHFGMLLDLTVDNITCAVFMLKLCSLPAAPPFLVLPCCAVLAVEAAQLSMAVNSSAAGRYWKRTDDGFTPWVLRKLWIKDGHHTNFGLFCVMAQQVAIASAWMWVFDPCTTWWGLMVAMAPFAGVKLWANSAVSYKLLRTWTERSK
jgi:cytidyltransferase-like protein